MEVWQVLLGIGVLLYLLIGITTITQCYERYELSDVRHKIFKNPINAIILVLKWPIVAMEM